VSSGRTGSARCGVLGRADSQAAIDAPCVLASHPTSASSRRASFRFEFLFARTKSGAKQISAFDEAAGERAEEVVLDDVRVVVFHALEPVRDMQAIADLLCSRLDELELG